jgi:hypothetical protein
MRTSIEIDDELLRQAVRSTGALNKEAVVDAGLRLLVQTQSRVTKNASVQQPLFVEPSPLPCHPDPDFLPRSTGQDRVCASLLRKGA